MNYGNPNKLLYAKKVLAALGYIALNNLDRVAVGGFSSNIDHYFPLARGKQSAWRLFEFLENISPGNDTDLYQACRSFALRFKSSSMIILISDFMDPAGYEQALKFFATGNKDVFIIHIVSPQEITPTLAGDLRLVDSETGQQTDLSISDTLLKRYQHILHGYIQELQSWCSKHDMFYLYTSTEQSFEDLVLRYLRRIGMLR